MKKLTLLFALILCASSIYSIDRKIDTIKVVKTSAKHDSICQTFVKVDTAKINNMINYADIEDSTKAQIKSIVADVPEAAQKADEIIKIVQNQEDYSSKLEWILELLGGVIAFLTFLAALVRKVRALPRYFSPIYLFEKLLGHGKTKTKGLVDINNNPIPDGLKADVKKVTIPEGYEVKITQIQKV
jgi:hypothetical protein